MQYAPIALQPYIPQAEAIMDSYGDYSEQGLRVGPAAFGLGVFSLRSFSAQEVIGPIEGQIFDDGIYESEYCMAFGEDSALEPDAPFRYLNHSCHPNCALLEYEIEYDDGTDGRELWLAVETDIEPGEQMTIDYGWPAESAIPCGCGSPDCRKWIVAAEQLDEVETRSVATKE